MRTIDDLLAELTLDEKVALCRGSDAWHTNAVERLGVSRFKVTDGPNGARGASFAGTSSACYPCGTALAATWDVDLIRDVGASIGRQVRSKHAAVLLGPTMNIHRSPLAGRNFECYSEDPHLSTRIAVAYIEGVQSTGVGACAKHFVANDSEFERHTISSVVDERTLREIFLPPFEASVREAGVWWVMAAYNKLNGTYCAEHRWLLTDLLRDEWGFEGVVVSDWWGAQSTAGSANGGLDLEMPGPGMHYQTLADAVKAGEVDEPVVDAKVRRVLATLERTSDIDPSRPEQALDADRDLIRHAAADGIVLLRNEDAVLPLDTEATIAVVGPNADVAQIGGGGSAQVNAHRAITPLQGIRAQASKVVFERGCAAHITLPELATRLVQFGEDAGMRMELFDNTELEGDPVRVDTTQRFRFRWFTDSPVDGRRFSARFSGIFTPDETGDWTFSLISAGRSRLYVDGELVVDNWTSPEPGTHFFGMGSAEARASVSLRAAEPVQLSVEYATTGGFSALYIGCFPPLHPDSIERAAAAAKRADAAVVVVGADGDHETEGRDREHMQLPGWSEATPSSSPQDELVAAVAAAQPNTVVVVNTGSPYAMPWAGQAPALVQCWFAGQELGHALADILFGTRNPSGKLPTTFPARYEDNPTVGNYPGSDGEVAYAEGVFVGYRHYDANDVAPRFCFGHGLSYTTFGYSDLEIERAELPVHVSVDIANTGSRVGAEVVQLYVSDPEAAVPRPPQELKGFVKLVLEPGETKTASFDLDERAFSYWGEAGWTLEPGRFELRCGSSSRDIRATATLEI